MYFGTQKKSLEARVHQQPADRKRGHWGGPKRPNKAEMEKTNFSSRDKKT